MSTARATKSVFWPIILLCGTSAQAGPVPWGYQKVAGAYGVPSDILYAIALTESNHKLKNGTYRPWPWTLNVQRRPERFATRKAAYDALRRYLRQGIKQIDVGLMQVNWRYHRKKLGSPWAALEPYHNLRVGTAILRAEYAQTNNWHTAIGRYHAPNNSRRAKQYRRRVEKHLRRIRGGKQRK